MTGRGSPARSECTERIPGSARPHRHAASSTRPAACTRGGRIALYACAGEVLEAEAKAAYTGRPASQAQRLGGKAERPGTKARRKPGRVPEAEHTPGRRLPPGSWR